MLLVCSFVLNDWYIYYFILYPLIGVRNKRVNGMHYALIVNCEKYKKREQ